MPNDEHIRWDHRKYDSCPSAEMQVVKHAFAAGIPAQRGIEH